MAREVISNIGNQGNALRQTQTEAYSRLHLSDGATLKDVVTAINYREGAREYWQGNTANDAAEANHLYEMSLTRAIQDELAQCLQAPKGGSLEALQTLTQSLRFVQELPIGAESMKKLDEMFFEVALDVLADETTTPLEKAAGVILSLHFGAAQRGVDKTQMILEQRMVAEQDAKLTHINKTTQEEAQRRLSALKDFFGFAGLEYQAEPIDSTIKAGAQKAARIAGDGLEKGRKVVDNGAHIGRKVASIAVIASIGVVGTTTVAAASENSSATQSEVAAGPEATLVAQGAPVQAMQVPMVATVEDVPAIADATAVEAPQAATVPMTGSVEVVDVAALQAPPSVKATAEGVSSVVVKATVEEIQSPSTSEGEVSAPVNLSPGSEQISQPATVKVTPTVEAEPLVAPEATEEQAPLITAPDSDVNVAEGETPQEAIARIVASRDMVAASYAMRTLYGGVNVSEQEPVNPVLTASITEDVATLRSQISEVAHADSAYTEKAFYALAYLDAVTQYPALLDNPEVAAFVASVTDQGEAYRNKLFATYLTEAHTALADEKAGAYNGIAEQYRVPIETLYAYVAMAGMSDQKQAEQIDAIKTEEARIAAEEEAKRIAAEQAQQGLSDIEIIASDEKRLVLTAIDRALQQGLITQRYADVTRLVIEQEGPTALVAAAGMVGNCMAEADGCNPAITERGNGIGFGIFQHSFGRRTAMEATAAAQNVDVATLEFQVPYSINESKGRAQRDNKSLNEWDGLMAQTDPAAAAEFWRWNFERPKEHLSSTNTRIQVAQEVYANITGQMDGIRNEAAAAKAAREAEIERQRQEQLERDRQAEEARKAAEAQGDIRASLADGNAIRAALKSEHDNVSGHLDGSELVSRPALYKDGSPMTIELQPDAAVGYDALAAAFKAHFGEDIRITDDYRDYDAQVETKAEKGDVAAEPGTSNHGWGLAIDFASNINTQGSPQHTWMEQNAYKYGWANPEWAHDGTKRGGAEEPWHWEFRGSQATLEESN